MSEAEQMFLELKAKNMRNTLSRPQTIKLVRWFDDHAEKLIEAGTRVQEARLLAEQALGFVITESNFAGTYQDATGHAWNQPAAQEGVAVAVLADEVRKLAGRLAVLEEQAKVERADWQRPDYTALNRISSASPKTAEV